VVVLVLTLLGPSFPAMSPPPARLLRIAVIAGAADLVAVVLLQLIG